MLPFCYGLAVSGLMAGAYGALVTGSMTTAFWSYLAYRDMRLRRDVSAALLAEEIRLRSQAEEAYNEACDAKYDAEQEVDRVQEMLLTEKELSKRLLDEVSQLTGKVAAAKTKDALVEALQRRVKNINAEYNDRPYRGSTTLEDVKKLTGES